MTDLSRSLLAAAREGLGPDAAAASRVRAKVAAAITAGAVTTSAATTSTATTSTATTSTTTTSTATTSAATTSAATTSTATTSAAGSAANTTAGPQAVAAKAIATSSLVKLGAALLVVGVAATALLLARSESDRALEPPRFAPSVTEAAPPSGNVHVAVSEEPFVARGVAQPAGRTRAIVSPATAVAPSEPPPARDARDRFSPPREPASLSREVELIDLAMVSLRKHAPLAAIEAIRVFDRETLGRGQMAEDAAAIEIEARCVLGEDVTTALARFDRTWPESAQRERIQRTCFARK